MTDEFESSCELYHICSRKLWIAQCGMQKNTSIHRANDSFDKRRRAYRRTAGECCSQTWTEERTWTTETYSMGRADVIGTNLDDCPMLYEIHNIIIRVTWSEDVAFAWKRAARLFREDR